jgi:formylglycine-generating enzyme required for sulfatase activity
MVGMLLAAGTSYYVMYSIAQPPAPPPAACPAQAPVPAAETAVVVHSYTGRTAAVGREIASMLGASFHEFNDPPPPDGTRAEFPAARLAELARAIPLNNSKTIFFGFPVWGEGPSSPADAFISSENVSGKKVVLFYTYLHHVDLKAVDVLKGRIKSAGAETPEPIAVMLSAAEKTGEIEQKTHRAVLLRRDLWAHGDVDKPEKNCSAPPDGKGPPSCPIPEGTAWVSYPESGGQVPERSKMSLTRVKEFGIDRREVTVGDYRRCEASGACPKVDLDKGYCVKFINGDATLPIPCASPAQAKKYCAWAGMRLPSLAEWTRAARGDSGNAFPWGDNFAFSGKLGNFGEKPSTGLDGYSLVPEYAVFKTDGYKGLSPSCSFPAGESPYGLCDMAGNLSEIVTDRDKSGAEVDLIVGGSWLDPDPRSFGIDSAVRWRDELGSYFIGFRCAK